MPRRHWDRWLCPYLVPSSALSASSAAWIDSPPSVAAACQVVTRFLFCGICWLNILYQPQQASAQRGDFVADDPRRETAYWFRWQETHLSNGCLMKKDTEKDDVKKDDKEQSRRFVETAKRLESDESGKSFEKAIKSFVKDKNQKQPTAR